MRPSIRANADFDVILSEIVWLRIVLTRKRTGIENRPGASDLVPSDATRYLGTSFDVFSPHVTPKQTEIGVEPMSRENAKLTYDGKTY